MALLAVLLALFLKGTLGWNTFWDSVNYVNVSGVHNYSDYGFGEEPFSVEFKYNENTNDRGELVFECSVQIDPSCHQVVIADFGRPAMLLVSVLLEGSNMTIKNDLPYPHGDMKTTGIRGIRIAYLVKKGAKEGVLRVVLKGPIEESDLVTYACARTICESSESESESSGDVDGKWGENRTFALVQNSRLYDSYAVPKLFSAEGGIGMTKEDLQLDVQVVGLRPSSVSYASAVDGINIGCSVKTKNEYESNVINSDEIYNSRFAAAPLKEIGILNYGKERWEFNGDLYGRNFVWDSMISCDPDVTKRLNTTRLPIQRFADENDTVIPNCYLFHPRNNLQMQRNVVEGNEALTKLNFQEMFHNGRKEIELELRDHVVILPDKTEVVSLDVVGENLTYVPDTFVTGKIMQTIMKRISNSSHVRLLNYDNSISGFECDTGNIGGDVYMLLVVKEFCASPTPLNAKFLTVNRTKFETVSDCSNPFHLMDIYNPEGNRYTFNSSIENNNCLGRRALCFFGERKMPPYITMFPPGSASERLGRTPIPKSTPAVWNSEYPVTQEEASCASRTIGRVITEEREGGKGKTSLFQRESYEVYFKGIHKAMRSMCTRDLNCVAPPKLALSFDEYELAEERCSQRVNPCRSEHLNGTVTAAIYLDRNTTQRMSMDDEIRCYIFNWFSWTKSLKTIQFEIACLDADAMIPSALPQPEVTVDGEYLMCGQELMDKCHVNHRAALQVATTKFYYVLNDSNRTVTPYNINQKLNLDQIARHGYGFYCVKTMFLGDTIHQFGSLNGAPAILRAESVVKQHNSNRKKQHACQTKVKKEDYKVQIAVYDSNNNENGYIICGVRQRHKYCKPPKNIRLVLKESTMGSNDSNLYRIQKSFPIDSYRYIVIPLKDIALLDESATCEAIFEDGSIIRSEKLNSSSACKTNAGSKLETLISHTKDKKETIVSCAVDFDHVSNCSNTTMLPHSAFLTFHYFEVDPIDGTLKRSESDAKLDHYFGLKRLRQHEWALTMDEVPDNLKKMLWAHDDPGTILSLAITPAYIHEMVSKEGVDMIYVRCETFDAQTDKWIYGNAVGLHLPIARYLRYGAIDHLPRRNDVNKKKRLDDATENLIITPFTPFNSLLINVNSGAPVPPTLIAVIALGCCIIVFGVFFCVDHFRKKRVTQKRNKIYLK